MNDRDLAKLERLAALVASGALTQEEYEVEKQRLLSAASGEGGEQEVLRDDEPPQQVAPSRPARTARSRRPDLTSRWPILAGLIGTIVLLGAGWLVFIKPQAPATAAAVEYMTTGSANVRDAPSATTSSVVTELAADVGLSGEVVQGSDGREWLKIAQGEYAGRYVWIGNLVRSGSAGAGDRAKFVGLWAPNAETCGDGYERLRLDANGTAVGWDTSGRWSVTQPGQAEVHWTSTGAGEDAEAMNERSQLTLAGEGTTLRMDNTNLVKCSAGQRPAASVQPASANRLEPDTSWVWDGTQREVDGSDMLRATHAHGLVEIICQTGADGGTPVMIRARDNKRLPGSVRQIAIVMKLADGSTHRQTIEQFEALPEQDGSLRAYVFSASDPEGRAFFGALREADQVSVRWLAGENGRMVTITASPRSALNRSWCR